MVLILMPSSVEDKHQPVNPLDLGDLDCIAYKQHRATRRLKPNRLAPLTSLTMRDELSTG